MRIQRLRTAGAFFCPCRILERTVVSWSPEYLWKKSRASTSKPPQLRSDLKGNLGISGLQEVRILNRYDVSGLSEEQFAAAARTVLSEPPMDAVYGEDFRLPPEYRVFAMEYLPGQYDQRADSAAQCVQLLTQGERPAVLSAKVIGLKGDISDGELKR